MREYDFAADRDRFGKFLFAIMGDTKGAELLTKEVNLSPDPLRHKIVRLKAFRPLHFDDGQVTIRNGYRANREAKLNEPQTSMFIEIAQFDGQFNDVLSGVPDRILATVGASHIPETPLGEVRDEETLTQLKLVTNRVLLNAGIDTPTGVVFSTDARGW